MKCVSGCKGLETDICSKSTRCSYASGTRRKFCRLSSAFKMRKSDCRVTRKIGKKGLKDAYKTRIGQFMKATKTKRIAEFLKAICSDSGVCIALGTNRNKITEFFSGFTAFEYVAPPINAIGNPSANGFLKEIKYERSGYISHAILKSSVKQTADNLGYEYLVGKFLNQMGKRFPCFVETYGLFYYADEAAWNHAKDTKTITTNVLSSSLRLEKNDSDFATMCSKAKHAAVLIQHMKNVNTLSDVFKFGDEYVKWFCQIELLNVLYQIYFPLSLLSKQFTHYDLHDGNVLLYEPVKGAYITYHYHNADGKVVKFNSRYIVKLIDYGRSYFYEDDKNNTKTVHKAVCREKQCGYCGDEKGFGYMNNENNLQANHFICTSLVNPSHDLRLFSILKKYIAGLKFDNQTATDEFMPLRYLIDNVVYGAGLTPLQKRGRYIYGTKPNPTSGIKKKATKVNNVVDAELLLRDAFEFATFRTFKNKTKLGDIHVYSDGRAMTFNK